MSVFDNLFRALVRLRDLHDDMTVVQLQIICLVASNPNITQAELYRRLDVTDSAISRNIALLSDIGSRTRDGLGIIRLHINPNDRRERILEVTKKGERLLHALSQDLTYGK